MFEKLILLLATGFGAGNSPKAPGTMGSLVGIPFGLLLAASNLSFEFRILVLVAACAFGMFVTYKAEQIFNTHDDQRIVIDEIIGQMIAFGLFEASWINAIGGFILFRLFDIWKPGPIGYIDERVPGAWGTFFDDVVAGIFAAVVLYLAHRGI